MVAGRAFNRRRASTSGRLRHDFASANATVPREGLLRRRHAYGHDVQRLIPALLLLVACESGPRVESGVFFPTWSGDGAVPGAIVQGVLAESQACVYIEANGQLTLPVWGDELGYADGALLGSDGEPIAEVGEVVHGGGGWYGGAEVARISKTSPASGFPSDASSMRVPIASL
jgi:hypothetical protein